MKTNHPFATNRFKTDGRGIFADIVEKSGDKALIDLASNQYNFRQVISPSLFGLEFKNDEAARWWPLGPTRRVVLDPDRSFGQPIIDKEGVPTAILARAFEAEHSEDVVARWYSVDRRSVKDAVAFEKSLAAA